MAKPHPCPGDQSPVQNPDASQAHWASCSCCPGFLKPLDPQTLHREPHDPRSKANPSPRPEQRIRPTSLQVGVDAAVQLLCLGLSSRALPHHPVLVLVERGKDPPAPAQGRHRVEVFGVDCAVEVVAVAGPGDVAGIDWQPPCGGAAASPRRQLEGIVEEGLGDLAAGQDGALVGEGCVRRARDVGEGLAGGDARLVGLQPVVHVVRVKGADVAAVVLKHGVQLVHDVDLCGSREGPGG